MTPIHLRCHEHAECTCEHGDFSESAGGDSWHPATVADVLARAAMHSMATGHTVTEHVVRDVTVIPDKPQ